MTCPFYYSRLHIFHNYSPLSISPLTTGESLQDCETRGSVRSLSPYILPSYSYLSLMHPVWEEWISCRTNYPSSGISNLENLFLYTGHG